MGVFEYMIPLWKVKQGDNMRFLMFVENWNYQQRPRVQRVSRPKRPEKAADLGYQNLEGYYIYHVQVRRGSRRKQQVSLSSRDQTHQKLAEARATRHVKNLKVIDSYWVSQDGTYKYYEVLMVDPSNDNVLRDYKVKEILSRRRRERTEVAGRMISRNLCPQRAAYSNRFSSSRSSATRYNYDNNFRSGGSHRSYSPSQSGGGSRLPSSSRSRDMSSYGHKSGIQRW